MAGRNLRLNALGLAVSGGQVSKVGVGGLTLGGGKSFFQSIHGFACDNVVNFELITGRGSILQVSPKIHPRLYKALKGGSGNFGIVTRFDLRAFKQGKLWGGEVTYLGSPSDIQLQALYNFIDSSPTYNASANGDAQVIYAYAIVGGASYVSNFSYTIPEAWPEHFAEVKAVGSPLVSTERVSNLTDMTIELAGMSPSNYKYIYATLTVRNSLEWYCDLKNITDDVTKPLTTVPGLVFSIVMQPLTASKRTAGCGKNSLGLCPSDGNLFNFSLSVEWTDAANDTAVAKACQELMVRAAASAKAKGVLHGYLYLNYALDNQDPIASYGWAEECGGDEGC